jgi:GNAT superfamily N-acetyltransferase
VWTTSSQVIAYFALSAHKVAREHVPAGIAHGSPVEIPAVLLAKCALDAHLQGRGLGAVLVADALRRVVTVSEIVGTRLVVVDALDESVVPFYEKLGFHRLPGTLRLVQKVSSVVAALR